MATSPRRASGGQGAIEALIPAFTAMIIGITGLMAITITMATYRENGILRRLRTTPVSPLVVMAAQVIVVFTMTSLGMLLLIVPGSWSTTCASTGTSSACWRDSSWAA